MLNGRETPTLFCSSNAFAGKGGAAMAVKCSRGHWYEPDAPNGTGRCPQCAGQTQTDTAVSDDDVLAIMNLPVEASCVVHRADELEKGVVSSSAITRRKKICPECSHEASYSFVYCPRCGAPLKLISVELH
jgi:hypothetical protein